MLLVLLPYLIYVCFKRPYLGLALWLWSSLVPVVVWGYGTATSIRWNLLFAACTIVAYFFQQNKEKVRLNGAFWLMILLFIHATFSSLLHIGFDLHVWQEWEYLLKATVFGVFVALIVKKKQHFVALAWACALSIGARAAIDGMKVVVSGGGHVAGGISPTFNDNNLSAMATLVCLPLLFFLYSEYKKYLFFKVALIAFIVTNVIFVLGSDSRGGLLGLLVLAGFFFMKSKHKFKISLGIVVLGVIGLSLMDAAWFERMESIKTAKEDGSFMGRVISWKLATILAIQNPIFGGGFDASSYGPTWTLLTYDFYMLSFIATPEPHTVHVAHSIYFQVLGDLGFVGLCIYMSLLYAAYRIFSSVRKKPLLKDWEQSFSTYVTLSIIAFAFAGAALSAAYNPLFFMLVGLTVPLAQIIRRD